MGREGGEQAKLHSGKQPFPPQRAKVLCSRRFGETGSLLSGPPPAAGSKKRMGLAGRECRGRDSCLELFSIIEADRQSWHHPCSEERLQDVSGYGIGYQVEVQRIFPFGWRKVA